MVSNIVSDQEEDNLEVSIDSSTLYKVHMSKTKYVCSACPIEHQCNGIVVRSKYPPEVLCYFKEKIRWKGDWIALQHVGHVKYIR